MPKRPKLKLRTFRLSDDTMHKLLGIVVYHRRKWREAGLLADVMSRAHGTELIRRLIDAEAERIDAEVASTFQTFDTKPAGKRKSKPAGKGKGKKPSQGKPKAKS